MASYLSGLGNSVSVGGIAKGTAGVVLVGVAAYGLFQIATAFKRVVVNMTPETIKNNEHLLKAKATISDKLGTLFLSTDAMNAKHAKDVPAKDGNGKEIKDVKGQVVNAAKKDDYINGNPKMILSGIALCLVALAGFKLMSYMSAGESPLNKALTYISPLQVAPSSSYTLWNTIGDQLSSLKAKLF